MSQVTLGNDVGGSGEGPEASPQKDNFIIFPLLTSRPWEYPVEDGP